MVTCNECGNDFIPLLENKVNEINGVNAIYNYLRCPKCDAVFFAFIETDESIAIAKKVRRITELIRVRTKKHNPEHYKRLVNRLNREKEKLNKKMKENEKKYRKKFEMEE